MKKADMEKLYNIQDLLLGEMQRVLLAFLKMVSS
jgi:hypothetical protein